MNFVKPVRLQLLRQNQFDMQGTSRALNRLPAKAITRPGKWGNPFFVRPDGSAMPRAEAVQLFRDQIAQHGWFQPIRWKKPTSLEDIRRELAGHNLFCACSLNGEPCHGDVLIELANPHLFRGTL